MKFCQIVVLIVFLVSSKTGALNAQSIDAVSDSIVRNINWYALQKPSSTLFVHFDKNIYTNNENVWFSAYLLNSNPPGFHRTLSVAVVRNDDRSVLAEGKFLMDNNLSYGNFYLPDSSPTGNYSFVCYTDCLVNGYPLALFIQPTTIKSANMAGFVANLSLTDSINPQMDSTKVLLKAIKTDVGLVKGASVTYFIGDRQRPLKTGKLKTDNFGEANISIPLKQITADNNILHTEVSTGKEVKTFSIKLPVYKKETIVKFYPEGGNLVAGLNNVVGWEVTNNEGETLPVSATLYQNNEAVQTLKTDAFGIGKFSFIPQEGSRYSVKLAGNTALSDTSYFLPTALPNGPVIIVQNALAADTLNIQLNGNQAGNKWIVMVHNYRETYLSSSITLKASTTIIKIPLADVPKGLNTFTLFDTLGRPLVERLFFAHYDKKAEIAIQTDSASYNTRQKVIVKFKVTNPEQPLQSLLSVACTQNNRFDVKKMTDIESYAFLKSEMAASPYKSKLLSTEAESKAWLENLVLVKGWRRYKWKDLATMRMVDTIQYTDSLMIKGAAFIHDKPLYKPVQLSIKKSLSAKMSTLELKYTDNRGEFEMTQDDLLSEPLKQIQLWVNNRNKEDYTIKVKDSYKDWNRKLAETLPFDNYDVKSFEQSSQTSMLSKDEGLKRLLDVTVKAKKDNSIFDARGRPGVNACGDYVCAYGILNCQNHMYDGTEPIIGRRYTVRFGGSGSPTSSQVYMGCAALNEEKENDYLLSIDGIYPGKEFYVTDMLKVDASDPQYLSTLYWNHSIVTNANGEAEVSFYTGDITGKFRIVIQGLTHNNVVYGEQFFEVRK